MKDFKAIISFTWNFLKPHKKALGIYIIVGTLYSMIELLNTFILGNTIDTMLEKGTVSAIIECAALFLIITIIVLVLGYFAKVQGQRSGELAVKECKMQIARHVESMSLMNSGKISADSYLQRLCYDAYMLILYVINVGISIPQNLITYLCALITIMRIDVLCGCMALLEFPVIVLGYSLFKDKLAAYNQECADKRGVENGRLFELVMDVTHIKKNQIYETLEKRYETAEDDFIESAVNKESLSYVYGIIEGNMDAFLKIALFFYGGFAVINGNMTIGEFMIIYTFFSLIASSSAYFLGFGEEIQRNMAFYNRLKVITDVPSESNGDQKLEQIDKISFENVNFGYNESELVVHNFSHTFEKGNMYVVAGENGCGKSTMLSILLGMYIDEFNGMITYNDIPIQKIDMRTLRKEKMGICEQEPFLINDTIRFNMTYSNEKDSDEKLMKIAEKVSFDTFLKNSSEGLDTIVGEGGNNLSGGQKQKTALIKVFYKNPDVLILDEPTSAMDAEGQRRLVQYLSELKKDKIVILVTHDPTVIEAADEVIKMS